jgi:hypothetical protein
MGSFPGDRIANAKLPEELESAASALYLLSRAPTIDDSTAMASRIGWLSS